jgi:hypothetical protein
MQQMLSPLPSLPAGQHVWPSPQQSPLHGVTPWGQHCDRPPEPVLLVHDSPGSQQNWFVPSPHGSLSGGQQTASAPRPAAGQQAFLAMHPWPVQHFCCAVQHHFPSHTDRSSPMTSQHPSSCVHSSPPIVLQQPSLSPGHGASPGQH